MKNIRWGIVGTGGIAHRFANAAKNAPGTELVAVASRKQETADSFANEFDIPLRFSSYEEMAESDEIDAAYIGVPHGVHAVSAKLFLKNKKPVLCEKPICVNADELRDLIAFAKENNTFLMEAMWARLVPGTKELISIVKNGTIGKVKAIEGDFCYDMSDEPDHHAFKPKYGGGSLLDVGVYALNFASWFAPSSPTEIKALAYLGERSGVDEHTCILMKYNDGMIASLSSGMTVRKPNSGFIYGEKGYIHINHFYAPEEIEINIYDGESTVIKKPYFGNGFEEQIEECNSCIRNGKTSSDTVTLEHSLYITEQMDEIRKQIGLIYPQDK